MYNFYHWEMGDVQLKQGRRSFERDPLRCWKIVLYRFLNSSPRVYLATGLNDSDTYGLCLSPK